MIRTIKSDTPFYVVFIDFWEPGDILDWDVHFKIITCLDCMKIFGIGEASGLRQSTPHHVAQWDFRKLFVPFGLASDQDVQFDLILWYVSKITPNF